MPVSYTGGPVWSMAWAPLPAHVTEQYLAVAGLQHMNHVVNVETSVEFASIVQIWKYGSLDNIRYVVIFFAAQTMVKKICRNHTENI